ncbi:MAG: hypothetical protein Q8L26_03105 [Candidatus Omnitrophota bacterium]|nr:hypothetical protein [Candidatus Omnitrophota bacterium]
MKKKMILTACFLFAMAESVFAGMELPKHSWDLGVEVSHISYKEPDVMKEEGILYGLNGSYAYRQGVIFKTDARFSFGQVDYSSPSSGNMDGVDDILLEVREMIGYDLSVLDTAQLMPYIGFGYRYLNDDSSGMATSTGAVGYERESNYFYLPLGIDCIKELKDGWLFGFTLEYDHFLKGVQKSHLSDANLGFADLENDQNKGYGCRASFRFKKQSEKIDFLVEPFVRYWNIKKSEEEPVSFAGVIIGRGYEPKNNSTEFGIKIAVKF